MRFNKALQPTPLGVGAGHAVHAPCWRSARGSRGERVIARVQNPEVRVGIGIASGTAYIGNIRFSDRLLWTVLGNTTNLAARLQGLTRGLGAAMIIDLATWRGAGNAAEGFRLRADVPIRGRSQREDLHLLP